MPAELTLVSEHRPRPKRGRPAHARDAGPFLDWVEQRIADHEATVLRNARECGADPPKDPGSLRALLNDIGWSGVAPRERLCHWRRREAGRGAYIDEHSGAFMASAELIDGALEHAGVGAWEVYPDAAVPPADAQDLFCPTCSEVVLVVEGLCAWCDTEIVRPRSAAPARPPRQRHPAAATNASGRKSASLRGLKPAPRPDLDALIGEPTTRAVMARRHGMPEEFIREAMRVLLDCDQRLMDAAWILDERYPGRWKSPRTLRDCLHFCLKRRGVLSELDRRTIRSHPAELAQERARITSYLATPDPGYAYRGELPAELLWEAAYRYYICGLGFPRIARLLILRFAWVATKDWKSLAACLHYAFQVNGWPTRPQREATKAANWRHGMTVHRGNRRYERHLERERAGMRPRCSGTSKSTGKRCRKFAMREDSKCYAHSELTRAQREADLAQAHLIAQRELVDSAPFVAWVRARVKQYGSQRAAAQVIGLNASMISLLLRTGGTSVPGKVSRGLIDASLNATLERTEDLLVPRFADLYDTTPLAEPQLPTAAVDQHPRALAA